ncbi:uncharacterized protein LOC117639359 isoform X2 [Thrips palmi]|uniref:Uncharacterized protein LOC117639359 isoform X2 n=1 Tax=Thrips palmi TaxID=161013 RepID=A0A6P8XV47_THRPL|nr:uncharacterized protein LOC117639359 isoform X2 [Thrips palmi]
MSCVMELLERLYSDGEPFAKRLCLAHNVFQSTRLPLPRKEEAVTNWLCQAADKFKGKGKRKSLSDSSGDFVKLWSTLHACITNPKFEYANIRPSTKGYIIEVLSKQLNRIDFSHKDTVVLECATTVFKAKSFESYFGTNSGLCVDFATLLLKSMSIECPEHVPLIQTCLTTFQNLSKSRNDLRLKFLDQMMFVLAEMLKSVESNSSVHHDIHKFVREVLFPHTSSDFFEFLRDNVVTVACTEKQYPVPNKFLTVLETARSSLDEDSFINLLTMICTSFAINQKDDKDRYSFVFPMYVCISYLVGFEVKKEGIAVSYERLSQICAKGEIKTMSLRVLYNMIKPLTGKVSTLNSTINGTSLSVWLTALVESFFTTSSLIDPASSLKLMSSLMDSFPFLVESNFKNIFSVIVAKPFPEDLIPEYTTFLCGALALYNKLSRLPHFTAVFIASLQDGFIKQQGGGILPPSHNMWLPPSFTQQLVEVATVMPSATSCRILNFLISHFDTFMEPNFSLDRGYKNLLLHTIFELITSIFRGIRLIELSTTDKARSDFCGVMHKLSSKLGAFGDLVLKDDKNDCLLLISFLNAAYHWAAQAVLIEQYADAGREELLLSIGTNLKTECKDLCGGSILSYLHPYLTHKQWESIYDKAVNLDNEDCRSLLIKLDAQLLSALLMFNSSQSSLPKVVAKRACALMVQKPTGPCQTIDRNLISNVITMASLLDASELLSLGDCLTASLIANQNDDSLNDIMAHLTEERLIACSLVCCLLKSLRRKVKASKRRRDDSEANVWRVAKAVLGKIDAEVLIQQELEGDPVSEELSSVLLSMASSLSSTLSSLDGGERRLSGEESDLTIISQHLHILHSFPLGFFISGCQDVVFLSLLSLALDCSSLAPSQIRDEILQEIFDHLLLGLYEKIEQRSPNLKGYIDHKALIGALAYFVVHHNVGSRLLELLLAQALHEEQLLEQILDRIIVMKTEGKKETPSKENLLLGTLFLQVSSGIKLKSLGSLESSVNLDKSTTDPIRKLNKTRKKIAKTFENLIQSQLVNTKEGLHAFSLCLEYYISLEKGIGNLSHEFESFCHFAVSSLNSSEKSESKAAESFILTVCCHRQKLNAIPEFLIKDVWSYLKLSNQPNEAILKAIMQAATDGETSCIIDDLLSMAQHPDHDQKCFHNMIKIWSMLMRIKSLTKVHQKSLDALKDMFRLQQLGKVNPKWLLGFLHDVLISQVKLNLQDMDLCFLILHDVKWPLNDHAYYISVARQFLSVLSAIFMHRFSFALDCVPSFMQMLQSLVNSLAVASKQRTKMSYTESTELAGIAFEAEKLVTIFTKPLYKKSLKRVGAYFIADLISIFETIPLCSSVKKHFENMVYALLKIMDDHALKFLLRVMSVSSTEIFKKLQTSYKKFHSFKGKL